MILIRTDPFLLFCVFLIDFCEITELSKIEGEATANNRKAKLIFFYEWDIKLEWSGKCFNFFPLFIVLEAKRMTRLTKEWTYYFIAS